MKIEGFFLWGITAMFLFSAGTPAAAAEVPGTYTVKVGAFQVSLLSEGQSDGSGANLIGADEAMMKKYAPAGTYPTAVNAFLVRTPDRLVLVDAGFGRELFTNLKKLGVDPEQISAVLLTHMHGDHIGGLLVGDKIAFPKAKLYLARQERDYWASEEIMKTFPADRQGGFKNAQKTLAAYGDAVQTFDPGDLGAKFLLPGIAAIAAFGHTPGHTLYRVESEGAKLLIWGDLTHAMAVQMPEPQVAMTYDVDPQMAAASRLAVLKYVAAEKIPVAGMHIPYPGIGNIAPASEEGSDGKSNEKSDGKSDGKPDGGYKFTPAP
ncbi:MAG: MBL fold metallo-hydrolase [Synergistaceae bacterium]|jgi:glyoxylase-like metal-dependent hydrolase (beta-lactamase superfamily II)|nr:MBL fold metallo-hydrolase [Synergistaceae bacterium]